jgi:hypothetical protein
MAFDAEAVAVDDTVTEIYAFVNEIESVVITNVTGSATIELIGPNNAYGDGMPIAAGAQLAVKGLPGEVLYGVCDTAASADVRVFKQGV